MNFYSCFIFYLFINFELTFALILLFFQHWFHHRFYDKKTYDDECFYYTCWSVLSMNNVGLIFWRVSFDALLRY